jgi:hypothetical protein
MGSILGPGGFGYAELGQQDPCPDPITLGLGSGVIGGMKGVVAGTGDNSAPGGGARCAGGLVVNVVAGGVGAAGRGRRGLGETRPGSIYSCKKAET